MQRLLKLMEHRNSVCENKEKGEAIFDVRAYHRVFQHHLSPTAFEKTYFNPVKRLSFSQYSQKTTNNDYILSLSQKTSVKDEIKPHQSKMQKRIVERIREKIQKAKGLIKNETPKKDSKLQREKKGFQSSYITARKKVFEKQLQFTQSEHQMLNNKELQKHSISRQIENKEKELLALKPTSLDSSNLFRNSDLRDDKRRESRAQENYKKIKYKYLQRVGVSNRRETQSKCESFNIMTSKIKEREATETPFLRKGFISVNRKKSKYSNLIVNSPSKKSPKKEPQQSQENRLKVYLKNFINQKKLGEDDIEIFPSNSFEEKQVKMAAFSSEVFEEITSKAASIVHVKDKELKTLLTVNETERVQIASITKVMTCLLVLTIADKFSINIKKEKVIVNQKASKMPGTSARLAYSDVGTVYQMLHGLMLPSGNDASIVLGDWGGKMIRRYSSILRKMKPPDSPVKSDKSLNFQEQYPLKRKSHVKLFIHHMNKVAKHLQLKSTYFANTHGLMNQKAHSCSQDVILLCYFAMKHNVFRQIVQRQSFQCKLFNRTFSHTKEIEWVNTNKLLAVQGFKGIKTGVTPAAGPCLASFFEISQEQYFIIVILKTRSCEMRFKETASLLRIVLQQLLKGQNTEVSFGNYRKALLNIQSYTKMHDDQADTDILNDCKQSSTSNSDRQDQDQEFQMSNYLAL